ncbi:hypothetical protein HD554DRAFT_1531693 [Boletus coccyginus]|nr:hypothetical protein HD554DRAFT_1531693 [Boletus coccyginus]
MDTGAGTASAPGHAVPITLTNTARAEKRSETTTTVVAAADQWRQLGAGVVVLYSQHFAKRNRPKSRSRSHSYERSRTRRRSRSRSRSHERERRKSKYKEKDNDRKKRYKDKEKKKDRDEKRSVLTGKKIKLKVHKDSRDLEMDANRENLLQFLNSTFE